MSRRSNIDHRFNIEGTVSEQRISGRLVNANLVVDQATSVYETITESDGSKVYIDAQSPLGSTCDHVFIEISNGSLQVRFGDNDEWITISNGLIVHGDNINYLEIMATPDGQDSGVGTYQLITAKRGAK